MNRHLALRTRTDLPFHPGDTLMDHRIEQPSSEAPAVTTHDQSSAEPSPTYIEHPVLSRLLDEVRNEKPVEAAYDRVHNRHNRGR